MNSVSNVIRNNRGFILVLAVLFIVTAIFYQQPHIAMWIGFGIAGYSAIANDSVQTLGTFLASNRHRPWWVLWLFIGLSMVAVFLLGWHFSGTGDVAHGRLEKIAEPQNFEYLQLAAPIILLVLTKMSMPVSTTFLILSVFSTSKTIEGMLLKTFMGYGIAFLTGYVVWHAVTRYRQSKNLDNIDQTEVKKSDSKWYVLQWITTLFLWTAWLMQDIANVAVFLPRSLSFEQVLGFSAFLFVAMGVLFYFRGGSIQQIVTEKTDITHVKSATLVDFIYAIILYIFKWYNSIPMSTTWVFLGLLAGRELALAMDTRKNQTYQRSLMLVMKDLMRAGFGLAISIGLAIIVNL